MRSLKRQLILWLVGLLTLVGGITGGISFYLALKEADALLDHQLIEIARSVDEGSQLQSMQVRFRKESPKEQARDFVIQVKLGLNAVRSSRPGFHLPLAARSGFADLLLPEANSDARWRAYTMIHPDRIVQVSQNSDVRLEIATNSAMRVLLPIATLIPLSWLLIGLVVSHLLKPLQLVTEAAARRELGNLEPLVVGNVPVEVAPLIHAMNALVYRLSQALSAQRHFLSDAAHELRTPLAALQLQIDNLPRSASHAEFGTRVEEMQRGVSRAAHLVAQLLHIARYEAHTHAVVQSATDLNAVVKNMIADFIPLADCRRIDLGLTQNDAAIIIANSGDIRILLGNLLDNAIRYTPPGGRVDIRIAAANGYARVEIADTGPGISEVLLPRVFDRFFRAAGQDTEGSGIGLSIVQAIAERESATVTLANRTGSHGLIAVVLFSLGVTNDEQEMAPPLDEK